MATPTDTKSKTDTKLPTGPDAKAMTTNGRPMRGAVQEDFSPKQVGRTNEVLAIWEPEINDLLNDKSLAGKVVTYDGVSNNVAAALRKHFELEVAIRDLNRDKNDPKYNTGRLEIRVPA